MEIPPPAPPCCGFAAVPDRTATIAPVAAGTAEVRLRAAARCSTSRISSAFNGAPSKRRMASVAPRNTGAKPPSRDWLQRPVDAGGEGSPVGDAEIAAAAVAGFPRTNLGLGRVTGGVSPGLSGSIVVNLSFDGALPPDNGLVPLALPPLRGRGARLVGVAPRGGGGAATRGGGVSTLGSAAVAHDNDDGVGRRSEGSVEEPTRCRGAVSDPPMRAVSLPRCEARC